VTEPQDGNGEKILIADDDPDILRFVELNLRLEGYEVITAADGEQAVQVARANRPDMVILDVMMPRLDGYQVCQALRQDPQLGGVCIIMLTAKSMSADKVLGLTAGADDYISKPFDPIELVARVKTTLRRTREMRAVSPLTGMPGNLQIEAEMQRRLNADEVFAVLWLDLDNFKSFNDRYGFIRGDGAINYLAAVMREIVDELPGTFMGHIGGDDFVVMCEDELAEVLSQSIIERFDRDVAALYDSEDAARGGVRIVDRQGRELEYPLIGISIGAASNKNRQITDHRELVELATEMKSFAKRRPGSVYAIDRRASDG